MSFAARTGLIVPLNKSIPFPDRFQLGGPSSVRMFRMNSMGPHDGRTFASTSHSVHWLT